MLDVELHFAHDVVEELLRLGARLRRVLDVAQLPDRLVLRARAPSLLQLAAVQAALGRLFAVVLERNTRSAGVPSRPPPLAESAAGRPMSVIVSSSTSSSSAPELDSVPAAPPPAARGRGPRRFSTA